MIKIAQKNVRNKAADGLSDSRIVYHWANEYYSNNNKPKNLTQPLIILINEVSYQDAVPSF